MLSRPARGAWVEINKGLIYSNMGIGSRPARGAWVEIERDVLPLHHPASRAPQGARGLKSRNSALFSQGLAVAPRKGRVG